MERLLRAVLQQNRDYFKVHQKQILKEVAFTLTDTGWRCHPTLEQANGGLTYGEMIKAAERAGFRPDLWQIAEAMAELFSQVSVMVPQLRQRPVGEEPGREP